MPSEHAQFEVEAWLTHGRGVRTVNVYKMSRWLLVVLYGRGPSCVFGIFAKVELCLN